MSDLIHAPFTPHQLAAIKEWQSNGRMHPMTCCDHVVMAPTRDGMVCDDCGRVQDWIPDCVVDSFGN